MDLRLLTALALGAAVVAAGVSIACLIRIEDLHRLGPGGWPRRRRRNGLKGQGKVVHLPGDPGRPRR